MTKQKYDARCPKKSQLTRKASCYVMSLHNDLGCLYRHSKQYMKAEKHLNLLLNTEIWTRRESPETLRSMNDYISSQSTKQYKKADFSTKEHLTAGKDSIQHPDTAISLGTQLFLWTWEILKNQTFITKKHFLQFGNQWEEIIFFHLRLRMLMVSYFAKSKIIKNLSNTSHEFTPN